MIHLPFAQFYAKNKEALTNAGIDEADAKAKYTAAVGSGIAPMDGAVLNAVLQSKATAAPTVESLTEQLAAKDATIAGLKKTAKKSAAKARAKKAAAKGK